MLVNVNVKNMALIDKVDIYFEEGLNILTGETGAGKSIIIGSIMIALGDKVPSGIVRDENEEALVELTFRVDDEATCERLKSLDVEPDDEGMVIISRRIYKGRSTVKINGESCTLNTVKKIQELLIEIHGQHDHQSLTKPHKQLEILDDYSGENVAGIKDELKANYEEYRELLNKRDEFSMDEEQRKREISFAEFEVNEIDSANLKNGEFEEVEDEFRKMSSFKDVKENMAAVYNALEGDGYSISSLISDAVRNISDCGDFDETVEDIGNSLADMESICSDLARTVRDYMDDVDYDEEDIRLAEERLNEINILRQKYEMNKLSADPVDNILAYRDERQKFLDDMNNYDMRKEELEKEIKNKEKVLKDLSLKLRGERQKGASKLEKETVEVLKGLNFLDARFKIDFKEKEEFSKEGMDEITFMISTNPGEDIKPLAEVASGGELSRIMLALKTILAKEDKVDSLIFDEIDTGISGRTAQAVAERMQNISDGTQIICITHLPQIAAMADEHFLIEKHVEKGKTVTNIEKLSYDESVDELARMLGGSEITDAVRDNAKEMKSMAQRG